MTSPPPGLPLAELTLWFEANVPSFDASDPPSAQLLTGGRSNLTYALTDASGQRWAVRRPPLGHIMPSAHDLKREFKVLSGLERAAFPAPRALWLCSDESIIGCQFLIMEFVDGVVLADREDTSRLTEAQSDYLSRVLVQNLVALHAIDPDQVGLADFGRPQGYLARQVQRWGEQWRLTKTRNLPSMEVIAEWLAHQVVDLRADLPGSIVHGDFRLDNAILRQDLSRVEAIVDWEMSTLGDPIADLAVMLVYWTEGADRLRAEVPVAQCLTSHPGFWTRDRIVEEYAQLSGRSLDHLPFCLVLACYKLVIIMESLVYRSRAGQQLGRAVDRAEPMDQAVLALSELALSLIDRPRVDTLRL